MVLLARTPGWCRRHAWTARPVGHCLDRRRVEDSGDRTAGTAAEHGSKRWSAAARPGWGGSGRTAGEQVSDLGRLDQDVVISSRKELDRPGLTGTLVDLWSRGRRMSVSMSSVRWPLCAIACRVDDAGVLPSRGCAAHDDRLENPVGGAEQDLVPATGTLGDRGLGVLVHYHVGVGRPFLPSRSALVSCRDDAGNRCMPPGSRPSRLESSGRGRRSGR